MKEQNEGVSKVFRSLDIYVKVAINYLSQPEILKLKDIEIYKPLLTKMLEMGVLSSKKQ